MGTRITGEMNAKVQEEQKCVETETKLFNLLSKKHDTMNAHQERRLNEICARSFGEKHVQVNFRCSALARKLFKAER